MTGPRASFSYKLPKVFIIGTNGYVGAPVARLMTFAGYRVYGLVRSQESAARVAGWDVIPVVGTLEDAGAWVERAAQCPIIIDCSQDNSNRAAHADKVLSALDAIARFRKHSLPEADEEMVVIYTSGLAVYGENEPATVVTEETEPMPGPFVAFRPGVERKVLEHPLYRAIVLRLPLMYGLLSPHTHSLFSPLHAHPSPTSLSILGSPTTLRSVAHVQDVATVYLRAVQRREEVSGQIFNVANRTHERWGEVVKRAAEVAGCGGTFTFTTPRTPLEKHRAGGSGVVVDPSRAERVVGFRQRHAGLAEGMERWYEIWKAAGSGGGGGTVDGGGKGSGRLKAKM